MLGDRFETEHHFESAIARARALYRIPTAPNSNRTLELCHTDEPILNGFAWPGSGVATCKLDINISAEIRDSQTADAGTVIGLQQPLPFSDSSFDMVILHRTLDQIAQSSRHAGRQFDAAQLFGHVSRVLVSGGLIAGCIDRRTRLKSLLRRASGTGIGPSSSRSPAQFSPSPLRQMLSDTNFTDIRLFHLLPNAAAPLRLVDMDPAISKLAFRHEIQCARRSWSPSGYLARRVAVDLGLYSWLEESVFFWAYKAC